MRKHKFLIFTLLSSFGAVKAMAQPTPQPQPQQPQQQQNQNMMMDCSQLTAEEKIFANKLNAQNKMVFCSNFNPDQRKSAMTTSGQMGQDGNLITNDQAVEKVARENNIMIPKAQTRPGGSCPVK